MDVKEEQIYVLSVPSSQRIILSRLRTTFTYSVFQYFNTTSLTTPNYLYLAKTS